MNLKIATIFVALSMATIVFAETAHADPAPLGWPTGATSWIGPRPQDDCAAAQALGYNGNAAGSASGTGSNGYHSYTQGTGIGALDACFNAAQIPGFVNCVVTTQTTADNNGIATITGNPSLPGVIQGVGQITDPSLGGGNLYQTACGGLGGSGTDGEFEWGTNEAILNVRVGPATAGPESGFGDGVASCLGTLASAHHGSDTAIFVQDATLGSYIGFTVLADWARQAGQSASGVDDNRDPGLSTHCGDGAVEPCTTTTQAGLVNDVTTYGGATAAVADLLANAQAPTSSRALNHDLDVEGGCNPLDVQINVDPTAAGIGPLGDISIPGALSALATGDAPTPIAGPNILQAPGGLTTAAFGYGGANGMLTVLVNRGPQGICYDVVGSSCTTSNIGYQGGVAGGPTLGGNGALGVASVRSVGLAPTFGWIWTGATSLDTSDVGSHCVESSVPSPGGSHVCEGTWDETGEGSTDCTGLYAGTPTRPGGSDVGPGAGDVFACAEGP